jgi:hypothetical protein
LVTVLVATILATIGCSIDPGAGPATEVPPPTPTVTHTPEPTWPATWTPVPTRTPTSAPTDTPTPVSGFYPPGAKVPAPTRVVTPLSFEFWIADKWCTSGHSYMTKFWIEGKGGDGTYVYYRDIDKIGGPIEAGLSYEYEWLSCGGAVGTFYVESAGQRVKKKFWVNRPDCCPKP